MIFNFPQEDAADYWSDKNYDTPQQTCNNQHAILTIFQQNLSTKESNKFLDLRLNRVKNYHSKTKFDCPVNNRKIFQCRHATLFTFSTKLYPNIYVNDVTNVPVILLIQLDLSEKNHSPYRKI